MTRLATVTKPHETGLAEHQAAQEMLAGLDRRPLVEATRESGRTRQALGAGPQLAADNLVRKAINALGHGDQDRATRYAARAVRLPFDDHEERAPAAMAAGMELFTTVSDAEESSAMDDTRWLDAALATLETADHRGRVEMRSVLDAMPESVQLVPSTRRRLDDAVADLPAEPGIIDLEMDPAEIDEADLTDHVISILEVVVAFESELMERGA